MANLLQFAEKIVRDVEAFVCGSPSNRTCIHYICSAILKIGNFQIDLENLHQGHNFGIPK